MRAGLLRHRVRIETLSGASDAYGEQSKTWTPYATVWAEILPITGKERMSADQVQADITHKITIRATSTRVPPSARVVFNSQGADRIFNVINILRPAERQIALQLLVQEQVAG